MVISGSCLHPRPRGVSSYWRGGCLTTAWQRGGRKLVYSFTDPDLVSELDLLTDPDFGKLDPDGDY
jgi:hypothetical protein